MEEATPANYGDSIKKAREYLWENRRADPPIACPCCDRPVKEYERVIYPTMVRWAYEFWHVSRNKGWDGQGYGPTVHVSEVKAPGGDYAKLRYWGLIESVGGPTEDGSKSDSGQWRAAPILTPWLSNRIALPTHAVFFLGKIVRLDGMAKTIDAIFDRDDKNKKNYELRFHFKRLMANIWGR